MKYIFTACKSQTVLIIGFILNLFAILHKESMHVSYIQTRVSSISEQNNSCNENNFIASHLTKTKFDVTFSSKESRRNMTRDFSRNLQHFWHLRGWVVEYIFVQMTCIIDKFVIDSDFCHQRYSFLLFPLYLYQS